MRLPHSEPYSEIRSEERAAFGWRVAADRVHHNWLRLIRVGASSLTRSLTVSFGCFEALLLDMRLAH